MIGFTPKCLKYHTCTFPQEVEKHLLVKYDFFVSGMSKYAKTKGSTLEAQGPEVYHETGLLLGMGKLNDFSSYSYVTGVVHYFCATHMDSC